MAEFVPAATAAGLPGLDFALLYVTLLYVVQWLTAVLLAVDAVVRDLSTYTLSRVWYRFWAPKKKLSGKPPRHLGLAFLGTTDTRLDILAVVYIVKLLSTETTIRRLTLYDPDDQLVSTLDEKPMSPFIERLLHGAEEQKLFLNLNGSGYSRPSGGKEEFHITLAGPKANHSTLSGVAQSFARDAVPIKKLRPHHISKRLEELYDLQEIDCLFTFDSCRDHPSSLMGFPCWLLRVAEIVPMNLPVDRLNEFSSDILHAALSSYRGRDKRLGK